MRAYCFTSGTIGFGHRIPAGATVIARGPEEVLRDYITVHARHCYQRHYKRRTRMAGTDFLAVPGMPEADSPIIAIQRLQQWCERIAINPPAEVRVLPR